MKKCGAAADGFYLSSWHVAKRLELAVVAAAKSKGPRKFSLCCAAEIFSLIFCTHMILAYILREEYGPQAVGFDGAK